MAGVTFSNVKNCFWRKTLPTILPVFLVAPSVCSLGRHDYCLSWVLQGTLSRQMLPPFFQGQLPSPQLLSQEMWSSWETCAPLSQGSVIACPFTAPSTRGVDASKRESEWKPLKSKGHRIITCGILIPASVPSQYPPQPAPVAPSLSKCQVSAWAHRAVFSQVLLFSGKVQILLSHELRFCISNNC